MEDMQIVYLSPHELTPYENNTRKHTPRDIEAIKDSIIAAGGFRDPIGIWGKQNIIVEGHGRQIAAIEMGLEKVPCIRLDDMTDAQRREYAIKHNRTAELSEWDFGKLEEEIARLQIDGIDLNGLDFDLDGEGAAAGAVDYDAPQEEHPQLSERFVVPPFTILDSRQGYWKERKEKWRALIGDNGQARANVETYGSSITKEKYGIAVENSMSILDPVLSEIICRWYLPADGCSVFDCFAGDTVFGFVSAYLGHNFTGVELRQEQADFNNNAVQGMAARYICDDGRNVAQHIAAGTQDLFFSCPPYFDLEQYSDLPNDASNQSTYEEFYAILDEAFTQAVTCLKDNRFAVVVCGDVRNKRDGAYYDFPSDIKRTFKRNGFALYNELILVDPVGTAAIRAANAMRTRKAIKVHQNVLVFYKGNTGKISKLFPAIEVQDESGDF